MGTAQRFEDLIVWQRAHAFVLSVYKTSSRFPKEELFGITSQFRRAAVSIAANVAEGFKKSGKQDKLRFFNISQASAEECRYYLILARDLGYATVSGQMELLDEVTRLLQGYMAALRR